MSERMIKLAKKVIENNGDLKKAECDVFFVQNVSLVI